MNPSKIMELLNQYGECPVCHNDKIGTNDNTGVCEGTLTIDDDIFTRTCKCGWSVKVDSNNCILK